MKNFKDLLRPYIPNEMRLEYSVKSIYRRLPKDIAKVIESTTRDDIVVDCGAHAGVASRLFAKKAKIVFAFEPDPKMYEINTHNTHSVKNIFTINAAVGPDNQDRKLYRHKNFSTNPLALSQSSSLMPEKPNVDGENGIPVRTVDLVSFINAIGRVKILKVDIEGYEIALLSDMISRKVFDKIEHVFVEFHDTQFPALRHETQELKLRIQKERLSEKFYFNWL